MKISIDQYEIAHEYIDQWARRDEYWSDLAIMLDEGDTEMAAAYMLDTGAIDSTQAGLSKESIEAEKIIEQIGRKYRKLSRKKQNERLDVVFEGTHLYDCEDCNHISFVKYGNEKLYSKELETCWECRSSKVVHRLWGDKS